MSGSLWKQLGLAWCWECRRVHHLAEAPCSREEQSMKSTFRARIPSVPDPNPSHMLHGVFRTHIFTGKPSEIFQGLTIKWHITNLCSRWFHLVFLNTERCPKSCCNQEAWTWRRKNKTLGGEKNQELRPGCCHTHHLL